MDWKPKTPYVAVDGIVEIYDEEDAFIGVTFIKRMFEPKGLAIPGGFVDIGETTENAVIREMREELSLDVKIEKLLNVYSNPNRDKRFHVISVVYICKAYKMPIAGDDAKEAVVYDIKDLPINKLVFDHKDIIEDYLKLKTSY